MRMLGHLLVNLLLTMERTRRLLGNDGAGDLLNGNEGLLLLARLAGVVANHHIFQVNDEPTVTPVGTVLSHLDQHALGSGL